MDGLRRIFFSVSLMWALMFVCQLGRGDIITTASGPIEKCEAPGALQPQPSPANCVLCVTENPLLIVGADGTTTAPLRVCNKGAETMLQLSVSDFRAFGPLGEPFPLGATRNLTAELSSQQDIREGKAPLKTGDCIVLRLEAAHLNVAGAMASEVWNRDTKLIDLKAIRYQVPFSLKVDGDKADAVTITKNRETLKGRIPLRNEDPIAYCVTWRLDLDGQVVSSGNAFVPATGTVDLSFTLPKDGLQWLSSGFLRSATQTGRLTLRHEPDKSFNVYPMAQKTYPVTAHLSYHSNILQRISNSFFVLVLLLAGILASLFISHALPMQRRRVIVKQRLADLEGRLAGLGELFNQRVLSLLRIEKRQLREALRQIWPVMPSAEALLEKLEGRVIWLEKRIDLTVRAGEQLAAIKLNDALAIPEADIVRDCCREVLEVVEKPLPSEDDLKNAETQLLCALGHLSASDAEPKAQLIQELCDRAERLTLPNEQEASDMGLTALFELSNVLQPDIPVTSKPPTLREDYVRAARAVAKAKLIDEYYAAVKAATGEVKKRRLARQQDLLNSLTPGPDESIECAQAIVRQVVQNVSVEDIIEALGKAKDNALRIEVDPPTPIPLQLVILRVRLQRPGLDAAVARQGVDCHWKINGVPLEQCGWTIGHYFEEPELRLGFRHKWFVGKRWLRKLTPRQPLTVEATLSSPGLPPITLPPQQVQLELLKSYSSMQLWLSLTSIAVTLIVLGLGMQAGAQEKIQSLDWVSGVIALFALGFGADVLKQMLAKSS